MARSQMLYIGKQGAISYPATGNIETGSGSCGTLAMWYHPISIDQWCDVAKVTVDDNNSLHLFRVKDAWHWRAWSEASYTAVATSSADVRWRFVVVTWDFTGGPGAGVLRLYLDGQEAPESPVSTASAPVGPPVELTIGPGELNEREAAHATYDHLTIWNEALTAQQIADLYARGREHVPQEADGGGTMLMQASWDEQFDAEVAQGNGAATLQGAADQYCRLDCRSRHNGKRFDYRIGMPAHDGSENDRVPLSAVTISSGRGAINTTNTDEYAQLDVVASGVVQSAGVYLAPWLPAPDTPMTLRVGIHVADATVPNEAPIAVGAHNYLMGDALRVTCGAGCTSNTVVSSALSQADGYWTGAELHVLSGALRDQKVTVAGSSAAGTSVTIDGQFSQAPAEGDIVVVTRPKRVEPPQSDGYLYRLEGGLDEVHDTERFVILELASVGAWGFTRFNLGRLQYYPDTVTREGIFFGKREDDTIHDPWECTLLIDRLEMLGPGAYEITDRTDDTFLVVDPASGESIKAGRLENLERETRRPVQHQDPAAVQAAMVEPGTWRHSVAYCPSWMEYDAENERLVSVLVGVDTEGVERVGYIHGTWNESAGLVDWEDDPDPRNPFLLLDDLRDVVTGRSSPYSEIVRINGLFQTGEDEWALVFTAAHGSPDGGTTCALVGAPDPYSFDPEQHFDPEMNPLTPPMNGYDKVVPEGGGIGLFANRDCEMLFVENPWAKRACDRFWGYGRAKTWHNAGANIFFTPARPLACAATSDFRNLRSVPWRNQIVAPAYGWFHWPHPAWFGPSTVGLLADDGGATQSDVGLWASEDGVHLERVMSAVLRNTPPFESLWMMPQANPPRLGARRLYWYREEKSGNNFNIASIRLDGEALYRLSDGALTGELETCGLLRTDDLWQDLRLNVDPKGGTVTVAVLDADTGAAIAGFDHADCDAVAEGVETRVTWNGVGLPEVADESIRLDFRLTRAEAGAQSPELYAWSIAQPLNVAQPQVTAVQVEGRTNPVSVANPQPELSWSYSDRDGRPQSAYHVLVASTPAKLDAGEGDLWDSGVVLSDEPVAKYAGAQLASEQTYFWKVRVRNSEGVWSEEW